MITNKIFKMTSHENSPNRKNIMFITQFSLLLAIEAIVCFTPLGSIPIGPIVATLAAIPVIITAIVMGTGAGALMGFITGLFSFIVWTFMPPSPVAFVFTPFYSVGDVHGNFWSIVICFVPRILIGVVAGISFSFFSKLFRRKFIVYGLSAILGSLTNTFLVLGGIFVFFGQDYATTIGKAYDLLIGLIGAAVLTNGIPEAIIGAVVTMAVCPPLKRILEKTNR